MAVRNPVPILVGMIAAPGGGVLRGGGPAAPLLTPGR
jgi:hypothetical protein